MERFVYIVLTQTGTRISRAIQFFTKAPYNHSSIAGDSKLLEMYSFCRYHKNLPLPAGFSQEHVDTCVFGMFDYIPSAVYRIAVSEEEYNRYRHIIAYFKKEQNFYSFNLMGFVGGILNVPIRRKRKFVCSQFVAYVLRESGIYTFDKDLFIISPDDFRHIPKAELIHEGSLREYYNAENGMALPVIPRLRRTPTA